MTNAHNIYQNRIDMTKDMMDVAKRYEERCAEEMRIKDMQERAKQERKKENNIEEETPKIKQKQSKVEIKWIHTIIENNKTKGKKGDNKKNHDEMQRKYEGTVK